jgi:hypothetical protein
MRGGRTRTRRTRTRRTRHPADPDPADPAPGGPGTRRTRHPFFRMAPTNILRLHECPKAMWRWGIVMAAAAMLHNGFRVRRVRRP